MEYEKVRDAAQAHLHDLEIQHHSGKTCVQCRLGFISKLARDLGLVPIATIAVPTTAPVKSPLPMRGGNG